MGRLRAMYGKISNAEARELMGGVPWKTITDHVLAGLKEGLTIQDMNIDHIIPYAATRFGIDREHISHYTNLELLTKAEHAEKSIMDYRLRSDDCNDPRVRMWQLISGAA